MTQTLKTFAALFVAALPLAHTFAAETEGKPKALISEATTFNGSDKDAIDLGDLSLKAPATLSFSIKPGDAAHDRRILSQADGAVTQAGALRITSGRLQIWDGKTWQNLLGIRKGRQAGFPPALPSAWS